MKWQAIRDALTLTATCLSIVALIRTYTLSRGKLRLLQQTRWGRNHLGYVNSQLRVGVSVLVTNPRPQPNVVVNWSAQVESKGRFVDVPVPSGQLQLSERTTEYGVIPLTIPAFGAVEAHLCLFNFPPDVKTPIKLRLVATDVFNRKHRLQCVVEQESGLTQR